MHETPLVDFHKKHAARLVEFAGWEMPIMYTGIKEEHIHTREHCSLFDVSHMGRLYLSGDRCAEFLDRICTRQIGNMVAGQSRYSHVCKEDGGILDDVIVSRMEDRFLIVCNASNREKIVAWLNGHRGESGVELDDQTFATAMAAVQGPQAMELLKRALPLPLDDLKRYHFKSGSIMGVGFVIARSGYTGEDG
ncbi:MAG: glycine cleavage system protein T, partial [Phycisphaerae bacterium]|nr:glycine cleavage system protein T [Phycisphaerae bacterium]